jgi:ribonuclease P protein subunit POP4
MSLPTPETLVRHELAGLHAEVVEAPDPDAVGIAGRVVAETTRTLSIESTAAGATDAESGGASRVRQVPKSGRTFEFALTDEAAAAGAAGAASKPGSETADTGAAPAVGGSESAGGEPAGTAPSGERDGEGVVYVTVDGARLESRPARRTETGGVSKWR